MFSRKKCKEESVPSWTAKSVLCWEQGAASSSVSGAWQVYKMAQKALWGPRAKHHTQKFSHIHGISFLASKLPLLSWTWNQAVSGDYCKHISSSGPYWSTPPTKLPPNNSQNFVDPWLAMSPVCFHTACSTGTTGKCSCSHWTQTPPSYWDSTCTPHPAHRMWMKVQCPHKVFQNGPSGALRQGIHRASSLLQRLTHLDHCPWSTFLYLLPVWATPISAQIWCRTLAKCLDI